MLYDFFFNNVKIELYICLGKGREKQENEKNNDEGGHSEFRDRRSRPGGPSRGGGGGRGRGGGRAGGRYPPRGNRSNYNNRPIETWDNSNTWDGSAAATTNHTGKGELIKKDDNTIKKYCKEINFFTLKLA